MPKSWVEKTGNVVWYKGHTEGGHFAAMEKPKMFVEDMESFVKEIWPCAT
jgi:microsomal epoxide hydrolase